MRTESRRWTRGNSCFSVRPGPTSARVRETPLRASDFPPTGGQEGQLAMAKLLLVEDNEFNADMLSRRLTRRGFEVVHVVDGLQAVISAQQAAPDLILMDMSLPRIDGWEATRRIKQDPQTAMIPVIGLTAHALTSDRERSLAAGCDEFETKPVDMRRLLLKIDDLLGGVAAHD